MRSAGEGVLGIVAVAAAFLAPAAAEPWIDQLDLAPFEPTYSEVPEEPEVIVEDAPSPPVDETELDPEEADGHTEAVAALGDALREQHPSEFGGLWRDRSRVFVAVVSNEAALRETVEAVFPEPDLVAYTSADYSEAQLEHTMSELNRVFGQLADQQGVNSLFIDVKENRVVLEGQQPRGVDVSAYVSRQLADMVIVREGQPPQAVDATGQQAADDADRQQGLDTGRGWWETLALAAIAVALSANYWRSSPGKPPTGGS